MGYRVAGKTGTAHKEENGGYAKNKYLASFVGFAPASDPRLVIAVMVDEPSAGEYYGGDGRGAGVFRGHVRRVAHAGRAAGCAAHAAGAAARGFRDRRRRLK